MDVIDVMGSTAEVRVTLIELAIINNALSEALNGLDLEEFATRMAGSKEEAQNLLSEVQVLIDRLRKAKK